MSLFIQQRAGNMVFTFISNNLFFNYPAKMTEEETQFIEFCGRHYLQKMKELSNIKENEDSENMEKRKNAAHESCLGNRKKINNQEKQNSDIDSQKRKRN